MINHIGVLVFSAHAEVVPIYSPTRNEISSILRARGGSSNGSLAALYSGAYSPRTRR